MIVLAVDLDPTSLPAKTASLLALARAGLPVPPGVVVPLDADARARDRARIEAAIAPLVADGPVLVRSALAGEDDRCSSLAGLGCTIAGLRDVASVLTALDEVDRGRLDPWLARLRAPQASDCALVQHEIPGAALVVAALARDGEDYVEVHDAGADALAAGASPRWAGELRAWPHPARPATATLCDAVRRHAPAGRFGLDVEIVVDGEAGVHLVQARPLAAELRPGWPEFLAEVERLGQRDRLAGTLVLDAEHNPEPLSPAHAWLVRQLATARPAAGAPTVLAGWLYASTLVRELPGTGAPLSATAALARLVGDMLPRARARLDAIEARLRGADRSAIASAVDDAVQAFLAMIDDYLGVLIPARRAATGGAVDRADPLCLRGRAEHADVLPARWDVAAPTLGELGVVTAGGRSELPTDEPHAATLLGEWDDHLFALGLAPLRRVYLAAAGVLALEPIEDAPWPPVFGLEAPELARAPGADAVHTLIRARIEDHRRAAALRPPARIVDGRAVPMLPRGYWRGLPIGRDASGPVARRRDLEHLAADPPPRGAIVVMPSLTAQTAVALRALDVSAVCCEHGGALGHAALMARELGLSALVGCRGCMDAPDGARAHIDARTGTLRVEPSPIRSRLR